MSAWLICILGGFGYAAILCGCHVLFTRQARRSSAAGAAFRSRVQRHVMRQGF